MSRLGTLSVLFVVIAVTSGRGETGHARQEAPLVFRATGFFGTAFARDRWWLVTPDGRPFYANGIDHVSATPDEDRTTGRCPYCDAIAAGYPDLDAWTAATVARLQSWGFNTLGPMASCGRSPVDTLTSRPERSTRRIGIISSSARR